MTDKIRCAYIDSQRINIGVAAAQAPKYIQINKKGNANKKNNTYINTRAIQLSTSY